ncbi:hypothetical protein J6590_011662 [Homalodisca vitripennis]|nr:hypothetical protein J6590_011662 [Homalodisca vitripennis]
MTSATYQSVVFRSQTPYDVTLLMPKRRFITRSEVVFRSQTPYDVTLLIPNRRFTTRSLGKPLLPMTSHYRCQTDGSSREAKSSGARLPMTSHYRCQTDGSSREAKLVKQITPTRLQSLLHIQQSCTVFILVLLCTGTFEICAHFIQPLLSLHYALD